jgi:hypothetical protein
MLIITVPHGKCDSSNTIRECDLVAKYVADRIYNQLSIIMPVQIHHADIYRKEGDLNRIGTFDTKWRKNISDNIKSGDILLDIHSFPNTTRSFGTIDGIIPKIVLLDLSNNHQQICNDMKVNIPLTKYMIGGNKNDIVRDALSHGGDAMLWEFNEETVNDTDIDLFIKTMKNYIITYPSSKGSENPNNYRKWALKINTMIIVFCILCLILYLFIIWDYKPEQYVKKI